MSTLNLEDIVAQFERDEPAAAAPPPASSIAAMPRFGSISPVGDTAVQEADLQRMVGEAQRNVKLRSGLIGQVMSRLRGDDLQRGEYKTMLARIDGYNFSEEAKLALLLVVSLQVLGFKVAVSGLEEMERFLGRFDPQSAAGALGRDLLKDNQTILRQLTQEVTANGRVRVTRALGVG